MQVTLVHIKVKPEYVDDFIEASLNNSRASVEESGNLRFDVLQSADDPTRFVLYEAYETAEDAVAHKGTDHYLLWRDTVADMMAEPRQGLRYAGLNL
ncbi:MAG: antibiotic biosynthesis monooxygenase [Armatimonadetes bacterium]|jgi:autoinducer 2-degrading protein|nr:antibiotic biosynthesis monooxygenase [Armatimonadota bacterium]